MQYRTFQKVINSSGNSDSSTIKEQNIPHQIDNARITLRTINGRQRFVPHLQHLHEKHKQIEFFNQILDAMTWG